MSPLSQPPANDYFNNVNYSPAGPSRVPPRTNARPPPLHRLSETESLEEYDELELPAPLYRRNTNESPVSPYTIVDDRSGSLAPSGFELDNAGRNSESSAVTASSQQSYPRARGRSSRPYIDDDETPPFVMKSDKHKRILGIDQKTSHIKRPHEKKDNSTSIAPGLRPKRSFPDIADRSSSPLPAPDVVPFLYQDIEVISPIYLC